MTTCMPAAPHPRHRALRRRSGKPEFLAETCKRRRKAAACITPRRHRRGSTDDEGAVLVNVTLDYDGPLQLKANQLFRARLHLATDMILRPGARVVLASRHVSDLGMGQMRDSACENYVVVIPGGASMWKVGPRDNWRRHPWNGGLELELVAGEIPAGSRVSVLLGGQEGASPGFRLQSFAESAFRYRAAIDTDGQNNWIVAPAEACPPIRIVGNRTSTLRVLVPRATAPEGPLDVHLKPEDIYGNVAGEGPTDVDVWRADGSVAATARLEANTPTVVQAHGRMAGTWQTLTAASRDGALRAVSNPFGPSPLPGFELFFGEIHGQSGLCDGTNPPAEIYDYARRAAGLDFAAVTSHDFELTAQKWKTIQRATRDAHRPGEFVTFLGYEWSGQTSRGGDNNVYFMDDEAPLVYSAPLRIPAAWDPAEGQVKGINDLRQVVAQLRGHRAMIVPHCGGRCCNFDFYDASIMPLFEIHSCHRSYEHIALESLRRKIRFGFIGGSDDHRGQLGDSHIAARERYFSSHSGLVAAYARTLTREGLWEAFFSRRVYATNGARIALSVKADDVPMGGELALAAGQAAKLSFWTRLDGFLDRVEILRDGVLTQTFRGEPNQIVEFAGDMMIAAAAEPQAYHVKVVQTDGGCAWSSPIWISQSSEP